LSQTTNLSDRQSDRVETLKAVALWLLGVLFFRVIGSILLEYRNYIPANFESNFLANKAAIFYGTYRIAFYAHIISGPPSLLIAAFLMFSGRRKGLGDWHRWLGKALAFLVLLVMLPSGLVMATEAFTGPIAGWGFAALTATTACCVIMAAWHASQRRFTIHQRWATRSFILLCSPLLLRLFAGATVVLDVESDWTYRFAAWGSWLIPLAIFEVHRSINGRASSSVSVFRGGMT